MVAFLTKAAMLVIPWGREKMSIKYQRTVSSLRVASLIIGLAMIGTFALLLITFRHLIDVLSIVGLFSNDFGTGLWFVWPVLALPLLAGIWIEAVVIRRAKELFADPEIPISAFGETMSDEAYALDKVHRSLRRYWLLSTIPAIAVGLLFKTPFLNFALAAFLFAILIQYLLFVRDKAKVLKADGILLGDN